MSTTSINIVKNDLNHYLNPDEDFRNLEIDLEENYSIEDEKNFTAEINSNDEIQMRKLFEEVERQHPRKIKDNRIEKYPLCCGTDTGIIGCGTASNVSDLNPFGIGITNYFKTVKAFSIIFLIMVIINIPVYVMYTQSHKENEVLTYQDALFKTTIGNIASTLYNCEKIPVSELETQSLLSLGILSTSSTSKDFKVSLNCQGYAISAINLFGISTSQVDNIQNSANCIDFGSSQNITISKTCSFVGNVTEAAKYCIGNATSTCEFYLDSTKLINECQGEELYDNFFLGYSCLDNELPIGFWKVSRENASIIVISIDVACILIFILSIIVISVSQKSNAKIYKENTNQISDYSIHIKDLELDYSNIDKEVDELLNHLNNVLHLEENKKEKSKNKDFTPFYEVNYPILNDEKLSLVLKKNDIIEKQTETKRRLRELEEKSGKEGKNSVKINKLNNTMENLNKEYDVVKTRLIEENFQIDKVKDVWITFNRMKYANNINRAYTRFNKCDRCCLTCCCLKKKIKGF